MLFCMLVLFNLASTFLGWLTSLGQTTWPPGALVPARAKDHFLDCPLLSFPCLGVGVIGKPKASCRQDRCPILPVYTHTTPLQLCSLVIHRREVSRQFKLKFS